MKQQSKILKAALTRRKVLTLLHPCSWCFQYGWRGDVSKMLCESSFTALTVPVQADALFAEPEQVGRRRGRVVECRVEETCGFGRAAHTGAHPSEIMPRDRGEDQRGRRGDQLEAHRDHQPRLPRCAGAWRPPSPRRRSRPQLPAVSGNAASCGTLRTSTIVGGALEHACA